jgi:hypothetical protein
MTVLKYIIFTVGSIFFFMSCKKNNDTPTTTNDLVFTFKFDSTQQRLNNIGQLANGLLAGRAAQSPIFNGMSVHYIELAKDEFTPLGSGVVVYKAAETTAGGASAIDFSKAIVAGDNQVFHKAGLINIPPGDYKYLRMSIAYQNLNIKYKFNSNILTGTVAGFIGFNTYVGNLVLNNVNIPVNANKLQGYWAFESNGFTTMGQAPAGATTVPNPIFATSPIPQGSCVVTAHFINGSGFIAPLKITGNENADVNVKVSLSTNKSVEWNEVTADGLLEPSLGENIADMGIRGMKPIFY